MTILEERALRSVQNISNRISELTLRDKFALSVISGAITSSASRTSYDFVKDIVDGVDKPELFAKAAYMIADAMLKERKNV